MAAKGATKQLVAKADASGFTEIGSAALKQRSGHVREEFLPELTGNRGLQVYREMRDNDATVGAVLFAITNLIAAVEWRVEPADHHDTEQAQELADLFNGMFFEDMSHSWDDFLTEALTFLPFGHAYFENVLKRRIGPDEKDSTRRSNFTDGYIGIRKLAPRPQESRDKWVFDDHGGLKGFAQRQTDSMSVVRFIPIERSLLLRTMSRKNNPEGVSILRPAYRSYWFLKMIQEAEANGIDRELNGLPVIRLPESMLKDEDEAVKANVQSYIRLLRDIRMNDQASILLPSDPWIDPENNRMMDMRKVEFELVSSNGTRAIDTHKVKVGYQSDIARSMLAQFLMLGHTGTGSFALAKDQRDLFTSAIAAFIRQITAPINRHLIPRIMQFNGWPMDLCPKLSHGEIDPVNLTDLGSFISSMSGAGAPLFPDEDLENDLRRRAGLPQAAEDRDLALDEIEDEPVEDDLDAA